MESVPPATLAVGQGTARSLRTRWGVVLLCAAAAFAQYSVSIGHGFVLDDASSVIGAAHTTEGVRLPLFEATINGQGRFYRPFGYLGFSLDYAIYGEEPWGFHLTCVGLHVLATAAFTALACYLIALGPALLAGLFFAIHPVHVEAVANIWNRTGVQSALFSLLAIIAWLAVRRLWVRLLLVNLLAFVAVGSKEGAVALPVLLVAVNWLRPEGRLDLRPALSCAPAFSVWLYLRRTSLGAQPTFGEYFTDQPLLVKVCTLGELLAQNAQLLFAPLMLRADYTEPTTQYAASMSAFGGFGWAISALFLCLLGWAIYRKHWVALGLGWVLASIWPYLHLLIPLGIPVAERWLYLPSAGVCLLVGQALWRLRAVSAVPVYRALVAVLLVGSAWLTLNRTIEWESPISLWSADAAKPNASAFTWGNYGLSLWAEERHGDALKAMMHARNLKPDWTVYELQYQQMLSQLRVAPETDP